jgi:transcriptional regulator with XRE-family HTH domain
MKRARARRKQDLKNGIRQHVDAGHCRHHVEHLVATGLSVQEIAETAGIAHTTISRIRSGRAATIWLNTAESLLGVPVPAVLKPGNQSRLAAIGTTRRLQALSARGFTLPVLAQGIGCSIRAVFMLRSGQRQSVHLDTSRAVAAVYRKPWDVDPVAYGVPGDRAGAARTHAGRKRWAPPACWDDEAIDDSAGFPDWTGACGTVVGYERHRRNPSVPPPCQPCKDAAAAERRPAAGEAIAA